MTDGGAADPIDSVVVGRRLWFYEASAVLAREQNRGTIPAAKVDAFLVVL